MKMRLIHRSRWSEKLAIFIESRFTIHNIYEFAENGNNRQPFETVPSADIEHVLRWFCFYFNNYCKRDCVEQIAAVLSAIGQIHLGSSSRQRCGRAFNYKS